LQQVLGIPRVAYHANPGVPFIFQLTTAVGAIFSGLCDVVLAYHAAYRIPWNTSSALKDPFRRAMPAAPPTPDSIAAAIAYPAWASRYLYEYGRDREDLALVPLNNRTNAARNPAAAMRHTITLEDYLAARMIRYPLCLFDMDLAVDGADAFVITTAERARDLPLPPVLINASALGMAEKTDEAQATSLRGHGQQVTVEVLRARSDFWIDDCDVYLPYDGFSIITLNWIENIGYCGPGEAPDFLRQHWDESEGRVLIDKRTPINPHGGSLSEGATQGSGHLREAVHQLQGLAGDRQVPGAERAIVTAGGFFFNAQGCTLRRA
jgi:acetyl-CoA acetyltransferase